MVFNKNFIKDVQKYVNEKMEEKKKEQNQIPMKNYNFVKMEENECEEDNVLFEADKIDADGDGDDGGEHLVKRKERIDDVL